MAYDPVTMGRRIASVRKKCGFSQLDLAETLYVSDSYISKIENGIREPSLTFMAAFAEITDTSLEYLIVGKKGVYSVTHFGIINLKYVHLFVAQVKQKWTV